MLQIPKFRSIGLATVALCLILALLSRGINGDLIFAASFFTSICCVFVAYAWREYGLLTWRCGIPIFYLVFFSILPLGIGDIENNPWDIPLGDIASGLWIASIGILVFSAGVIFFSAIKSNLKPFHRYRIQKLIETYPITLLLILVGGTARILSVFVGYASVGIDAAASASLVAGILAILSPFLPIGMLTAWAEYFRSNSRRHLIVGASALAIMVCVGFFSNSKGAILIPLIMVAILKSALDRKPPIKQIIFIGIIYLFFAYPLVSSFRHIQQSNLEDASRSEILSIYIDYFFSAQWLGDSTTGNAGADLSRSLLLFFSKIVTETGKSVDFLNGESYLHGVSAFVPRFIMPDKLNTNIGNVFGQHYGVLDLTDEITNVAPTLMGEFFANFGLVGLVLGMFLMGYIAVWVDYFLISDHATWLTPTLVMALGWQESVIGHTFLSFIKEMIILFLFLYLVLLVRIFRVNDNSTRAKRLY